MDRLMKFVDALFFIFYFLFFIFYFLFFIFYFLRIIDILVGMEMGFYLAICTILMFCLGIGVLIFGLISQVGRKHFRSLSILLFSILILIYSVYFLQFKAVPIQRFYIETNQLWMALPFIHIIWLIYRKDWQFLIPFYRSIGKQKHQLKSEEENG